jgi:DNA-directed RNA polymerase subunit RPC12/RpoP
MTTHKREPVGWVKFECEACGLTGELDSPQHMEYISCPNCNAAFIYWPEGRWLGEKSPWKCVVQPYGANPPNRNLS